MKKGLSVLLIVAALFGFYGGATSLNDILASKDYWEEVGEKSTADMNKLEDGLNQLKDNEKAYLDGQKELADGEVKLADAEKELADGEAKLADGRAELAKGYADYAAAPGKLADGKKKIEEGETQLDGLSQLMKGINQILSGYTKDWRPGYEKLKDGRKQLYDGSKGSKADLLALSAFLDSGADAYEAAVNDVAGDDGKQAAKDYKDFIKSTNQMASDLPKIQKNVKEQSENATNLYTNLKNFASGNPGTEEGQTMLMTFAGACAQYKESLEKLSALDAVKTKFSDEVGVLAGKYATYASKDAVLQEKLKALKAAYEPLKEYDTNGDGELTPAELQAAMVDGKTAEAQAYIDAGTEAKSAGADVKAAAGATIQAVMANKDTIVEGMQQASGFLSAVNESVNGANSKIKNQLLPGLKQFNSQATADKIDELSEGQKTIASGIGTVATTVLGTKALREGVKNNMGSKAIVLLKAYAGSSNPLSTKISNFAAFETQMDSKPGLKNLLAKANVLLAKTKASGEKDLAAGKAEYKQGLADYAAAPAKLADGERQLAEGEAQLADGYKQYEDGKKQLADGKAKLAEYEDGEQQVRDGLATLMATEADPGLESILERRNGDDKFDDANGHLELDKGLEAVETGRGYQADSGELITKEITNRAVGTAAGLAAGALAVLAAILSFIKKNKGAAVSGVLAAVAGGVGAGVGLSAGEYYSDIAGSTIGNTPFIAAAILAAVAAVFAIVHFTAKPEAK
ncbi:MAG: hypothetical protein IKE74_09040 [Mogibacterium sp.]|nr:hypothetical protein [Mogibacterium sp.]